MGKKEIIGRENGCGKGIGSCELEVELGSEYGKGKLD
jgi:hypothetical protein